MYRGRVSIDETQLRNAISCVLHSQVAHIRRHPIRNYANLLNELQEARQKNLLDDMEASSSDDNEEVNIMVDAEEKNDEKKEDVDEKHEAKQPENNEAKKVTNTVYRYIWYGIPLTDR